jgi:subtilase family serine protease
MQMNSAMTLPNMKKLFGFLSLVALLSTVAIAQSSTNNQAVPARVVSQVNDAERVTLRGNVHPLARARYDRGAVEPSEPSGRLLLLLRRSASQQQRLTEYLAAVQQPSSPSYHKWLTPAQFGEQFGPAAQDVEAVQQWLQAQGFRIEKMPAARNVIVFSGTMGQVGAAFRTSIHAFAVSGKTYFANVTDPQVPAALAPVIAGVGRLNNFVPKPNAIFNSRAKYHTDEHRFVPDLTLFDQAGNPYLYVDPADAATIYDTPNTALNPAYSGTTYDGSGVNIGIAGDSNITVDDVRNYRMAFLGETADSANVPTVVVDGGDPEINGDEAEALLDTEISGGIAPKAKVYLYTSANTDLSSGLFNAIFRAVDDNLVSILNISFGGCEANLGTDGNALIEEAAEQAAAQGISVTVSTGDSGSAGCDNDNTETAAQFGLAVNGLASSPYVTAVGGTDFNILSSDFSTYVKDADNGAPPYYRTALSYIPEEPWNDSTLSNVSSAQNTPRPYGNSTDIIAAGGGMSQVYAKPAFQQSLTPADKARDLPDVSLLAANGFYQATWAVCADSVALGSPETFTDCQTKNGVLTGSTTISGIGGTSAAAPAFAGMLALVEQKTGSRLGQADYVLYQLAKSKYAKVFHDATTGDNSVVCASGTPNCADNGFLTGYDAGTGYDLASGLGSVDAAQMVANWNSVSLATTSTTLKINGSTAAVHAVHGTSLTFEAGVNPAAASGVVGIVDTANETQNGALNNGQISIALKNGTASANYNGLPGGSYTVYGRYGGDAGDAASNSSPISVDISSEPSTVALALNIYDASNPSQQITNLSKVPYGSYVLGDASVYGKAEGASGTQGLATGSVKYTDGSTVIAAAVPISTGNQTSLITPSATYPYIFPLGSHSVVASYAGDASYDASSSTPVAFTVVKGDTSVGPYANTTSLTTETSTWLDVPVFTDSLGAAPTGTITLTDNGAPFATISNLTAAANGDGTVLADSRLTIQGSALSVGANVITASYSGDAHYAPSSGTITITVAASKFSLNNSGAITVSAGATTGNQAKITASSINGFAGLVNLSCAVSQAGSGATAPTCTVPATINLSGSAPATAVLTVVTSASTTSGAYTATVTGTDAATGKISATTSVSVTVTGGGASGTFSLSSGGNITIAPGATTGNTTSIAVKSTNGFSGAVTLSCSIPTVAGSTTIYPTCSVPQSVNVAANASATATLTIGSAAPTSAGTRHAQEWLRGGSTVALGAVLFFLVPARRRLWRSMLVLLCAVIVFGAAGCGGSSHPSTGGSGSGSGGTTAGTYSVTVTGTDSATGKITAQTVVTVTVQ